MRGRGLLIAAAVLQLAGAAIGLVAALSMLFMAGAATSAPSPAGLYALSAVDATIAAIMIPASIGLLRLKRWGWYASTVVIGLFCAAILAMPLTGAATSGKWGIGLGEAIVMVIVCAPIFVTFGLLVGGRRAVFAAAKTAAEPTPATPPGA